MPSHAWKFLQRLSDIENTNVNRSVDFIYKNISFYFIYQDNDLIPKC